MGHPHDRNEQQQQHDNIRNICYDQLESILNVADNNTIIIVCGDFNAKTGSGSNYLLYKENIGKFGKGIINSNGESLLEFANRNNLCLTNTFFNHKLAHRATWVAPEKPQGRRNPVRNQIDYILVNTKEKEYIKDSRSYSGIFTYSDHRMVIMA